MKRTHLLITVTSQGYPQQCMNKFIIVESWNIRKKFAQHGIVLQKIDIFLYNIDNGSQLLFKLTRHSYFHVGTAIKYFKPVPEIFCRLGSFKITMNFTAVFTISIFHGRYMILEMELKKSKRAIELLFVIFNSWRLASLGSTKSASCKCL